MSGDGTATIEGETAEIHTGDAIPAALGETRAFAATGNAPLEFMIIGIARNFEAKAAYMLTDEAGAGPAPAESSIPFRRVVADCTIWHCIARMRASCSSFPNLFRRSPMPQSCHRCRQGDWRDDRTMKADSPLLRSR